MKRMVLRARLSTLAFALCCLTGAYAEPGSVLSATGGRFVYGQVSAFGRDQFMLDTQDGRLWRIVCIVERGLLRTRNASTTASTRSTTTPMTD